MTTQFPQTDATILRHGWWQQTPSRFSRFTALAEGGECGLCVWAGDPWRRSHGISICLTIPTRQHNSSRQIILGNSLSGVRHRASSAAISGMVCKVSNCHVFLCCCAERLQQTTILFDKPQTAFLQAETTKWNTEAILQEAALLTIHAITSAQLPLESVWHTTATRQHVAVGHTTDFDPCH